MPALQQLQLLVNLAQIDGRVAEREKTYIRNIGYANGFADADIEEMIEQRHPLIIPNDLDDDEKFSYIFSLVQLMKIDERMYKEEILFCAQVASRLGYDPHVMFDLMLHVKAASMAENAIKALRNLTMLYLKKQ